MFLLTNDSCSHLFSKTRPRQLLDMHKAALYGPSLPLYTCFRCLCEAFEFETRPAPLLLCDLKLAKIEMSTNGHHSLWHLSQVGILGTATSLRMDLDDVKGEGLSVTWPTPFISHNTASGRQKVLSGRKLAAAEGLVE
jgi:hypothetical protein